MICLEAYQPEVEIEIAKEQAQAKSFFKKPKSANKLLRLSEKKDSKAICVREPSSTVKEEKKVRPLLSTKVFHSKDRDTYGHVSSFLELPVNTGVQERRTYFESDNEAVVRSPSHDFQFPADLEKPKSSRRDIYSFY